MNVAANKAPKIMWLRKFLFGGWGSLLLIDLVFIIIMSFVSNAFLSKFNIFVVTRDISTMVLIGFSQMVVLAIGQMNLSLGAIGGLAVIISGGLMEFYHLPIGLALSIGLLIGVLAGFINGFIIAKTGINSFIVTIASSSLFLGLNLGITQAKPFYNIPPEIKAFGQARIGFLPYMTGITLVIIILLSIFFYYMVAGRQILAIGGNIKAAETSGIPINRTIILTHVISGFLAAIAGILWMSQLGSAQPMIGSTWLLPSFATPIIGGVALSGGGVAIAGTILGSVLIAIIQNSLVHLQIDPYYVQFLLGLLILGAVGLNQLSKQGRKIGSVSLNEQE